MNLADIPIPPEVLGHIGDYELLEVIGRGGMGVVYKARQRSLNRMVALKMVLGGAHASDEYKRRFQREAETAAKLQHPNIVPIYEIGQHEDRGFFSMEYIEGADLARVVGQKPLPPGEAAHYALKLAQTVQYAHDHGVLHRDLKPANIMVGLDGRLRITDFGLARRMDSQSGVTLSGEMLGSPSYLPPEQISARHGAVNASSDVYALGAVLYFLLTGRPPFLAGSLKDTLTQVRDSVPLFPRKLNPAIPRRLEAICLKCLQKNPARRYASAKLLAGDLEKFIANDPGLIVHPSGAWITSVALWIRQPLTIGLLVLVGALLVSGVMAYRAMDRRLEELQPQVSLGQSLEEIAAAVEKPRIVPGGLLQQLYFQVPGSGLATLNAWRQFPRYPDAVSHVRSFEVTDFLSDNTGVRISGRLVPLKSAYYIFYLAAQDEAVLFLSEDESEIRKQIIAREPAQFEGLKPYRYRVWQSKAGAAESGEPASNISPPAFLQAGKHYYIEALMKHKSAQSYLGVCWRSTDESAPRNGAPPIPAEYLALEEPVNPIAGEPDSIVVREGERANLRVGLAAPGYKVQWLRNGNPEPLGTNLHFVSAPLKRSDSESRFRCVLENPLTARSTTSREVMVKVMPDDEPPRLLFASAGPDTNKIYVGFSERIDEVAGLDLAAYQTTAGPIVNVTLGPEGRFAVLELNSMPPPQFEVRALGIKDFAGNPLSGATEIIGTVTSFRGQDINNRMNASRLPGITIPCGERDFDVLAVGVGFGIPRPDDFHFTYQEVDGNFEASVLITRLDCSAVLAVAGLMVRESLEPNSTQLHIATHPVAGGNAVTTGALLLNQGKRASFLANRGLWQTRTLPTEWLMIKRFNNTFSFLRSEEGNEWKEVQSVEVALPQKVFVGAATASHLWGNRAQRGYASYRNLRIRSPIAAASPATEGSRPLLR